MSVESISKKAPLGESVDKAPLGESIGNPPLREGKGKALSGAVVGVDPKQTKEGKASSSSSYTPPIPPNSPKDPTPKDPNPTPTPPKSPIVPDTPTLKQSILTILSASKTQLDLIDVVMGSNTSLNNLRKDDKIKKAMDDLCCVLKPESSGSSDSDVNETLFDADASIPVTDFYILDVPANGWCFWKVLLLDVYPDSRGIEIPDADMPAKVEKIIKSIQKMVNNDSELQDAVNGMKLEVTGIDGEEGWYTEERVTEESSPHIKVDDENRGFVTSMGDFFIGMYTLLRSDQPESGPKIWADADLMSLFIPKLFNAKLKILEKGEKDSKKNDTYKIRPTSEGAQPIYKYRNYLYMLFLDKNHYNALYYKNEAYWVLNTSAEEASTGSGSDDISLLEGELAKVKAALASASASASASTSASTSASPNEGTRRLEAEKDRLIKELVAAREAAGAPTAATAATAKAASGAATGGKFFEKTLATKEYPFTYWLIAEGDKTLYSYVDPAKKGFDKKYYQKILSNGKTLYFRPGDKNMTEEPPPEGAKILDAEPEKGAAAAPLLAIGAAAATRVAAATGESASASATPPSPEALEASRGSASVTGLPRTGGGLRRSRRKSTTRS